MPESRKGVYSRKFDAVEEIFSACGESDILLLLLHFWII
jgi:hypothetical protein